MEPVRPVGEVVLDDSLSINTGVAFLSQLAPRVGARVVERARVKGILGDWAVDVGVAERDLIPLVRAQLLEGDLHRRAVELASVFRQDAFDLAVKKQDVVLRARIRLEAWLALPHVRHGKNREVVLGDRYPPGLAFDDDDTELPEESKDAAGLAGARCIMVARDDHYSRLR